MPIGVFRVEVIAQGEGIFWHESSREPGFYFCDGVLRRQIVGKFYPGGLERSGRTLHYDRSLRVCHRIRSRQDAGPRAGQGQRMALPRGRVTIHQVGNIQAVRPRRSGRLPSQPRNAPTFAACWPGSDGRGVGR